jgi:hypothetical protein
LLINREQETDKNKFFATVIFKLFGIYNITNQNNLNNIFCEVNSNIQNKISVIWKGLQSLNIVNYLKANCLKLMIADHYCIIEFKYFNIRTIDNEYNFIFASNKFLLIKYNKEIESMPHLNKMKFIKIILSILICITQVIYQFISIFR